MGDREFWKQLLRASLRDVLVALRETSHRPLPYLGRDEVEWDLGGRECHVQRADVPPEGERAVVSLLRHRVHAFYDGDSGENLVVPELNVLKKLKEIAVGGGHLDGDDDVALVKHRQAATDAGVDTEVSH